MRDEHVKKLLDEAPLSSLGTAELAAVRAHAEICDECGRAFDAAQAASLMLKARTQEAFEPSPFFQTRVLAALRERRGTEEGWTLARLWKSAGLLVSSLAATTAALAVFTFVAPSEPAGGQELAAGGTYTAESVIFDDADEDQMTYDQVITSLYGSEDEAAR
jgi:drug/metabolite transporter superfamily protein YnfA